MRGPAATRRKFPLASRPRASDARSDMAPLTGWENFYVMVGSAAGALVGLQFVVLTLVSERIQGGIQAIALETFTTPTIVHFGAVLLLSGAMVAPLPGLLPLAVVWGVLGVAGVLYALSIARCFRHLAAYTPQTADWIYYVFVPLLGYAAIAASGGFLARGAREAAFAVAAAALLLLFAGIHNAWDIVTYHVLLGKPQPKTEPSATPEN